MERTSKEAEALVCVLLRLPLPLHCGSAAEESVDETERPQDNSQARREWLQLLKSRGKGSAGGNSVPYTTHNTSNVEDSCRAFALKLWFHVETMNVGIIRLRSFDASPYRVEMHHITPGYHL